MNGKLCAQVVARELLAQHAKQYEERPLVGLLRGWAESGGDKLRTRYVTAQAVTSRGPQCPITEPESVELCPGTALSCFQSLICDTYKKIYDYVKLMLLHPLPQFTAKTC